MLLTSLRTAFAPYGLLQAKLIGVDITKSYQQGPGLVGIVTLHSSEDQTAALDANLLISGQQVFSALIWPLRAQFA